MGKTSFAAGPQEIAGRPRAYAILYPISSAVERLTVNQVVAGSIPALAANSKPLSCGVTCRGFESLHRLGENPFRCSSAGRAVIPS